MERFRGRSEIDLDEVGLRQAEATADRISQWQVQAVYSSPQRRALQTAQSIARRFDLPAQLLEGLTDMDFGEWQGLSLDEARSKDGELYRLWTQSPHLVIFPGGETLEQVRKRAVAAVESLVQQYQEQEIVCVAHKVLCKVLLCAFLDLDNSHFWRIEQDTCAINLIEMRDRTAVVTLLNDICHLKDIR